MIHELTDAKRLMKFVIKAGEPTSEMKKVLAYVNGLRTRLDVSEKAREAAEEILYQTKKTLYLRLGEIVKWQERAEESEKQRGAAEFYKEENENFRELYSKALKITENAVFKNEDLRKCAEAAEDKLKTSRWNYSALQKSRESWTEAAIFEQNRAEAAETDYAMLWRKLEWRGSMLVKKNGNDEGIWEACCLDCDVIQGKPHEPECFFSQSHPGADLLKEHTEFVQKSNKTIKSLLKEMVGMREALEFYADDNRYHWYDYPRGFEHPDGGPNAINAGKLARAALPGGKGE